MSCSEWATSTATTPSVCKLTFRRDVYGHKIVLSSACDALERLLVDGVAIDGFFTAKTVDNVCLVEVNYVTDETLVAFLKYIYSGKPCESPSDGVSDMAKVCHLNVEGE